MKLKKRFKRLISILLPLPLMLCLSGCWSYHELNNYSYVIGVGIDKGEASGTFKLIEQIAVPSNMKAGGGKGGGGGETAFWNVDNEGETVFATIRDLTRKLQRKPFYGHNKVIVFGREIAEEGIFKYLDFYARDTEPRISTSVIVAKDKAAELLAQKPHLEKITADKIEKVLDEHVYNSNYHNIQIMEFLEDMLAEKKAAVVPILELVDLKVSEEKSGGGGGGGSGGQSEGGNNSKNPEGGQHNASENTVLVVNGCAIFKDYKMVGQIDNIEGRAYSFATNNAVGGIIVIESPENGEKLDIEFNTVKSTIKPIIKNGKAKILIQVKMETSIAAQPSSKNYATPEKLKKVQQKLNETVKKEIMASVNKSKEMKADFYGFGDEIYKKNPKLWKKLKGNWDEELKKLEVEVKVEAVLSGAASISSIAKPGENK